MNTKLTVEATRALGCLVEKELATPEYYPLSLNGLVSACNQKNNREPIMAVELEDVADAIDELRQAGLALQAAESARVPRYGHNLRGKLHLEDDQAAVLCELLLRGPQTSGELRGRASRLRPFPNVTDVERVLESLIQRETPLVAQLPVQAGRKEHRYAHLMSGEIPVEAPPPVEAPAHRPPRDPRAGWREPPRTPFGEPPRPGLGEPRRGPLDAAAPAGDDAGGHGADERDADGAVAPTLRDDDGEVPAAQILVELRLLRAAVEALQREVQALRRRGT